MSSFASGPDDALDQWLEARYRRNLVPDLSATLELEVGVRSIEGHCDRPYEPGLRIGSVPDDRAPDQPDPRIGSGWVI